MKPQARVSIVLLFTLVVLSGCNRNDQAKKQDKTEQQLAEFQKSGVLPSFESRPPPVPMPVYSTSLDDRVPPELMVIRAQPAVFRILIYGNIDLRVPAKVVVNTSALQSEWLKSLTSFGATAAQRNHFFWSRIIADPDTYLSVSSETSALHQQDTMMASGTGFLVSRDGIVITNAHVVSDMEPQPVPDDRQVLLNVLGPLVDEWMTNFAVVVGAPAASDQQQDLALALISWMRQHSRITGTFTRASLAMQLAPKKPDIRQLRLGQDISQFLRRPPVPIVAPLTVLAKGVPMPGKDVAILKVSAGDWDPIDRAVCLPLGDSDDVLPGTRVQAFGFPGVAFNPDIMRPEAEYRCTIQDGQIGNTKPMTDDWHAFEMTADINHGDSGGPVLDSHGRVIAINVGSASGASGHTLAVPINYAKQMLDNLGVRPDPGPATALWIDALLDYAHHDYAATTTRLDLLEQIQAGVRDTKGVLPAAAMTSDALFSEKVNPYVLDMSGRTYARMHPTPANQAASSSQTHS